MAKCKLPGVRAWAWKIREGLCHFAEPSRGQLERDGKPSPEAKLVRVRLIAELELRQLVEAVEAAGGE